MPQNLGRADATVTLAAHDALFLAWKTDGPVRERSVRQARRLWISVAVLWPLVTIASNTVNHALFSGIIHRGLATLAVLVTLGGIFVVSTGVRRGGLAAFFGSCEFLLGTIGASAASHFPVMLRAMGGTPSP